MRKKGFALPAVLVLMSIVVALSLLSFSVALLSVTNKQVAKTKLDKNIILTTLCQKFLAGESVQNTDDFNVSVLTSEENTFVKALVLESARTSNLYFYAIYDFGNEKMIAYQTQNFYLSTKQHNDKDYFYLMDMIRYLLYYLGRQLYHQNNLVYKYIRYS